VLTSGDYGLTWLPAPFGLPDTVARSLGLEGAATGVLWVYVVLLGLNALQLASYVAIRVQDAQRHHPSRAPIWQNLCEGWRYCWTDAGLATALIIAGLVNLAAFPLQFNLLPVFARDVFSVGAAGLGLLVAALGAGALLGSFIMVTLGSTRYAGSLMLFGTLVWCGFLLVFAFTPNFYFALGILALIGVAQAVCMTNITIMLLGRASSDMRGRVMGIRSLAVAPLFFGSMLSGAAAAEVGAPLTTVVCAVVGIIIVVCVAPWVPKGR
jgi:predicted MFS family arabinose efflux permease